MHSRAVQRNEVTTVRQNAKWALSAVSLVASDVMQKSACHTAQCGACFPCPSDILLGAKEGQKDKERVQRVRLQSLQLHGIMSVRHCARSLHEAKADPGKGGARQLQSTCCMRTCTRKP